MPIAPFATTHAHAGPPFVAVPAVEVDDLRRQFVAVKALHGLSNKVKAAEVHAQLGSDAAGKTDIHA